MENTSIPYPYPSAVDYLDRKAEQNSTHLISQTGITRALTRPSVNIATSSALYGLLTEAFAEATCDHLYNLLQFVYCVLSRAAEIRPAQKPEYDRIRSILNNRYAQ